MVEPLDICVMLGGPSREREVSLKSGAAVASALREIGHRVVEVDPADGRFELPPNVDVVFLALHGTYGEDGTVQSQLDKLGIPYTGCDAEVSRLAFDKVQTKRACAEVGLALAKDQVVTDANVAPPLGLSFPLVLKPVTQGSSVGLVFVEATSAWPSGLAKAMACGGEILVEEQVVGREVTVGIVDGEPLPIVEIIPKVGAYDYANKYTVGATEYVCPAEFDGQTTERIQTAARRVLSAVGGESYARVDFIVRECGEPVLLEVNTLPGMTETSLLPKAAKAAGMNFTELCQRLVDLALRPIAQLAQSEPN